MLIKEGKVYVTRSGHRVAVVSDCGRPGELFNATNGRTYHENGRVCGKLSEDPDHCDDIVGISKYLNEMEVE